MAGICRKGLVIRSSTNSWASWSHWLLLPIGRSGSSNCKGVHSPTCFLRCMNSRHVNVQSSIDHLRPWISSWTFSAIRIIVLVLPIWCLLLVTRTRGTSPSSTVAAHISKNLDDRTVLDTAKIHYLPFFEELAPVKKRG